MKQLYGNYLGLCINNNDPEKRGRVQVFIPHIMPLLFENWNEVGEDIKLVCVGDNLPDSLPAPVVEKLMKILPWAESASPILGTSSPGNLLTQIGSAIGGAVQAVGNFFNQSPVPQPLGEDATGNLPDISQLASGAPGNLGSLMGTANGFNAGQIRWKSGGQGLCGIGSRAIIGAMTNNRYFANGISYNKFNPNVLSSAAAGSLSLNNNYLQNSGYYRPRTTMPSNYASDPSQWKIGDVITSTRPGAAGHIQVWTGTAWVSDHKQPGIYLRGYGNFALHRMNESGAAAIASAGRINLNPSETLAGAEGAPAASGPERTSTSGTGSTFNPHQDSVAAETNPETSQYGTIARPQVQGFGTPTGRTVSTNGFAFNNDGNTRQDTDLSSTYLGKTASGIPNDSPILGYTIPLDSSLRQIARDSNGNPVARIRQPAIITFRDSSGKEYRVLAVGNDTGGRQITGPRDRGWGEFGTNTWRAVQGQGLNVTIGRNSISGTQGLTATYQFLDGKINNLSDYNALKDKLLAEGKLDPTQTPTPIAEEGINNANPDQEINNIPSGTMVNNTDKHGPTAVLNLNNMAAGVFTYPAAGALLWVFFREGNPLYPVYFAANYGQQEWSSAYRLASDGAGYKPAPTEDNPVTSTGGIWNIGKVGALRWEDTTNPLDPTQDKKSLMVAGYDGSNMFFNEGYHQIFSKFDRRDQVEGDRWESTLGYKEEWVQGDSNEVVMGDVFVKVGNITPPAVDAVTRIQEIINEIMTPLTRSNTQCPESNGGGGGGGTGGGGNSTPPVDRSPVVPDERGEIPVAPQTPLPDAGAITAAAAGVNIQFGENAANVINAGLRNVNDFLYSSPNPLPSGPRGGRTGGRTTGDTQGSEGTASSNVGIAT